MKKWKWNRTVASEWAGIVSAILVLVFGALPYLGIQPPSAKPGINDPTQHPAVGWPFYVSLATALVCVGLFYLARRSAGVKPNPAPVGGGDAPPRVPEKDYYNALADNDVGNMIQRIHAATWQPARAFGPNDPYIDFKVTFVNASVFELKSPRIKGTASFDTHPLPHPPQFAPNGIFPLSRGMKTWVMIRQFLTPETAKKIQERINVDRAIADLDFSGVGICFDVEFQGRQKWEWTWWGRDRVSVKETTTF